MAEPNKSESLPAKRGQKDDLRYAGDRDLSRASSMALDELARRANECARKAEGTALYHVACAGVYLLAAKDKAPHGEWHDWLSLNWHGSVRQADRYIEVAKACGKDPSRVDQIGAKSVRGVLALVGKPQDGGAANRSRGTEITEGEWTVTPTPPPPADAPRVAFDSLDDSPVQKVDEQKKADAASVANQVTASTPKRQPIYTPPAAPVPMVVAVCPLWREVSDALLAAAAKFSESRMKPAPLGGEDVRAEMYAAQAKALADFVREWVRNTNDCAEDEPTWIRQAANARGGAA